MKNKLSRFAVPYVVWMAIFVVAPILIMVVYAFSTADGGFTLENFAQHGHLYRGLHPLFQAGHRGDADLPSHRLSHSLLHEPGRVPRFQRMGMVLIMLPMWMNFLLRTYSWMTILENQRSFEPALAEDRPPRPL